MPTPRLAPLLPLFLVLGCAEPEPTEPTFWQDVAPIVATKCAGCHAEGGIAGLRFDDAETAAAHAGAIDDATQSGRMPPFLVRHDGACGDFQDEATLTPGELDIIHRWATGGRAAGERVEIPLAPIPSLADAVEYRTPEITPVVDPSNPLGAEDEYRCFLLDPGLTAERFITGYQVTPGNAAIVHHVTGYVVDPSAASMMEGRTNQDLMTEYDEASPDRDGWDCFGAAGEGITFRSFPVTWGPGQMVVEYPGGAGLPVAPTDRLVVQVHYNLHGSPGAGAADSTVIRLRYAESVKRRAFSLSNDAFLATLWQPGGGPDSLPPRQQEVAYTWSSTGEEMGISPSMPPLDLLGVLPHMHGRGRTYELHLQSGAQDSCIARVDDWDTHWQNLYWYRTPLVMDASTSLRLTCTYDTRDAESPVLPGWGSGNEMCTATMLAAFPETP